MVFGEKEYDDFITYLYYLLFISVLKTEAQWTFRVTPTSILAAS